MKRVSLSVVVLTALVYSPLRAGPAAKITQPPNISDVPKQDAELLPVPKVIVREAAPVQLIGPPVAVSVLGPLPTELVPVPAVRSSILFAGPKGMKVSCLVDKTWGNPPIITPDHCNFIQGRTYRLRLSSIPGRDARIFYPTLEVSAAPTETGTYLAHNRLPVSFSEDDFNRAKAGDLVVKVYYLPTKSERRADEVPGPVEIVSTKLEPGTDPVAEAARLGTILAVVRMSDIDLCQPGAIEQTFRKVLPPAQPSKSLPPARTSQGSQPDLLLPPDAPSINVDSSKAVGPAPGAVIVPPPSAVPPVAVPDADILLKLQPGEATMMGSNLAYAAVVGASLLLAPEAAADPKDDMADAVRKLEAAVKKLEATEKSLTDYKLSNATAVRQLQDDMESLKTRVRQLEMELDRVRGTPPSVSRFGPSDPGGRMARVRLSNEYLEEMAVVVNGRSYRLVPGETRTISVPAGSFTYQILQLQRNPQYREIAPDEEKPIRIFAQRPY